MKAASLPWQWLRFSLLYPWGHSTCPFSTTGCAGKKANTEQHRQQSHPPGSYLLLRPPCRRDRRCALGKPVMMPRAEGEVDAATFPKWWLLLLGRCHSGGSEVLPVLHYPSLCHLSSSLASSESQVAHDKGDQSRRNDRGPQ